MMVVVLMVCDTVRADTDDDDWGWASEPVADLPTPAIREPSTTIETYPDTTIPSMDGKSISCRSHLVACGKCMCCFSPKSRTSVVTCEGEDIKDIPEDIPRNATHM